MSVATINGNLYLHQGRKLLPMTNARARQMGRDAAGMEIDNPFAYDEPLEQDFWEAFEDGRQEREENMADEYADYCDPSMRDLYE